MPSLRCCLRAEPDFALGLFLLGLCYARIGAEPHRAAQLFHSASASANALPRGETRPSDWCCVVLCVRLFSCCAVGRVLLLLLLLDAGCCLLPPPAFLPATTTTTTMMTI
jgi:hypothetical protein